MNKLTLNVGKISESILGSKVYSLARSFGLTVRYDAEVLYRVHDFKYFGITLENGFNYETHLAALVRKISFN